MITSGLYYKCQSPTAEEVQTMIDESIAAAGTGGGGASTETYTVTVPVNWTETTLAGYYQTLEVAGMLETDDPIVTPVLGSVAADNEAIHVEWAKITKITATNGYLTLNASEALTMEIDLYVKVVRA